MGLWASEPEEVLLDPPQVPGAEALLVAVQEVAPDTVQDKVMDEESFLGTAKGEPEVVSWLLTLRFTVGVEQIFGPPHTLIVPVNVQVSGLVQALLSSHAVPLVLGVVGLQMPFTPHNPGLLHWSPGAQTVPDEEQLP